MEEKLTPKEEKEIIEGVYDAFLNGKEIMDLIGKMKSHHWLKVIEGDRNGRVHEEN